MNSFAEELRTKFDNLSLHPIVIEFIIDKIEDSKREKENLLSFIKSLILNNLIINVPDKDCFIINYDKIRTDILLAIIFIRFNKEGYQDKQLNHCFKSISQYYSFVKILDEDLASIILRYFRYVPIKDAELKRINFKEYNWNYSHLSNVKINQCKFEETSMEGVVFKDVSLKLCNFKNMKLIDFCGKVSFNLCHLLNTQFTFSNENVFNHPIALHFKNCIIDKVDINLGSNRNPNINDIPSITFEKCEIRELYIGNGSVQLKIDISSYMMTNPITLDNVYIINDVEYSSEGANDILSRKCSKCRNYKDWLESLFKKGNTYNYTIKVKFGEIYSYNAGDFLSDE